MAQNKYDGPERGVLLQSHDGKQIKERFGFAVQQPRPHGMIPPATSPQMNPHRMFEAQQEWKYRQRPQTQWAYSGPTTQPMYLGSGPKSCGTGVFIPRPKASNYQFRKKPGMSIAVKHSVTNDDEKLEKKEMGDDVIYISPDVFLPKEWTY